MVALFFFCLHLFGAVGFFLLALGYWEPTPFIIVAAFIFCSIDQLFAALKSLVASN